MAEQWTEEHAGQAPNDQPAAIPGNTPEDAAILQEIRDALKFWNSYASEQLKAEEEQAHFAYVDQWDQSTRESRAERVDPDNPDDAIPAKPTIEAHLLDQNIQQVVSEARRARLALTVKPKGSIASTEDSENFKGLVRTIQVDSNAPVQRIWALERAIGLGRGGYRVVADYAGDGDFDLDLIIERILDYANVAWDPYSEAADYRDSEWNFEWRWMSEDTRKRRWPNKPLTVPTTFGEGDLKDWFEYEDSQKKEHVRCRVMTFRKVIHNKRTLAFHPALGQKWLDEFPEAVQDQIKKEAPGTRTREVDSPTVMIYTVDGLQVLEATPWKGRYIPVIPVIGREYIVKGKRRYKGIIANAMDILSAIDVVLSAAVEMGAMMPRSPYIMLEGQDEGYEKEWNELYTANRTRIHVKGVDLAGKPAGIPQRQITDIQVQGMLLLLRELHEMYHAVTGSVAPQFRSADPKDRSGKAIEALQAQGAAGTAWAVDNLANISLPYEGLVLIDAIPHYYDRPGRVIRVMLEEDGDSETAIMIKRPFVRGPGGEPVPVPCPVCQGAGVAPQPKLPLMEYLRSAFRKPQEPIVCQACEGTKFATKENMPETWQEKPVHYVDFGAGVHKVQAVLDRDFRSKQDEALAGMDALAAAVPALVPRYADLWVRAMGFSGSAQIADRIAPPKDGDLDDMPAAYRGKFEELKARHDQAMQALQEMQKLLETEAMKTAGQKEIAVIRGIVSERLEKVKLEGRMLDNQTKGELEQWKESLRADIQMLQQENQHRHEVMLELLKEQKEKEVERHSVELHDQAARMAEARMAGREDEVALRDEAREVRGAILDEGRATAADLRAQAAAEAADSRAAEQSEAADQRAREAERERMDREAAQAREEEA